MSMEHFTFGHVLLIVVTLAWTVGSWIAVNRFTNAAK